METGERIHPARRRICITALALAGAFACAPIAPANAADITPAVTTTTTSQAGTYNEREQVRVTIDWSVASAASGDTFRVPFDPMLDPTKFVPMTLKDPAGADVANLTIEIAQDGSAQLVFTFTDYALTHTNLTGQAWFEIGFDISKIVYPGTSTSVDTTIYGQPITITKSAGPVGNELMKYGNWRSPNNSEAEALALNPDGSSANAGADILWTVQLQGGALSQAPGWTTATVTDTVPAGAGWHFECPLTPAPSAIVRDTTGTWVRTSVPQIAVTACSSTAITLQVTKATTDANVYRVRFPGWIDGAPLPAAYDNNAALVYEVGEGTVTHNVGTSFARSASGGNGTGIKVLPPSGTPKLAIKKVALKRVTKGASSVKWRITVTNTGTATASKVRICDLLRDGQSFPTTAATLVTTTSRSVRLSLSNGAGCVTISSLAVGKRATLTVTTFVPRNAKRVRNAASASATGVATVRASAAMGLIKGVVIVPPPIVAG